MAGSSARIQVGEEFSTFQDLQDSIIAYQAENFVQLYVRSSRSVESAWKRTPKKLFKEGIVYSEVDYACIYGGRRFVSKSRGGRPNRRTSLKACPFLVQVRTNVQGTALFVKSINVGHNHAIEKAPEAFTHLPHQRRLDASAEETTVEPMEIKASKMEPVDDTDSTTEDRHVPASGSHKMKQEIPDSDDQSLLIKEHDISVVTTGAILLEETSHEPMQLTGCSGICENQSLRTVAVHSTLSDTVTKDQDYNKSDVENDHGILLKRKDEKEEESVNIFKQKKALKTEDEMLEAEDETTGIKIEGYTTSIKTEGDTITMLEQNYDVCREGFGDTSHRKEPISTHTGENYFQCDICDLEFTNNDSLCLHNVTCRPSKKTLYECSICCVIFFNNESLKSHLRTHT